MSDKPKTDEADPLDPKARDMVNDAKSRLTNQSETRFREQLQQFRGDGSLINALKKKGQHGG